MSEDEPRRVLSFARIVLLILISVVPLKLATAQQNPDLAPLVATIHQNAIIRQEISPPPTRQPSLRGRLEQPIAGVPPEKLAETRFKLTSINFEPPKGIRLDPAIVASAWQGLIGKEISLRELGTALESIENIYRQHDYVVVAKAPQQNFSSGNISIVAYAVYVTEVDVKVDDPRLVARLDSIFAGIKAMRPLRQSAIYRQLLIAEDLVNGEINADWFWIENEQGAARLEITIAYQRNNFLLSLDNFGAANVGPLEASAKAQINDMLGLFESTDLTFLTNPTDPARLALFGFAQTVPLGSTGFNVSYGVANSLSNLPATSEEGAIHSEVLIANVGVNYALLRQMERNVIASVSLNTNDNSVDVQDKPTTRTRARWLSAGVKYDDVIGGVRIVLEPAFLQGVDALQSNAAFSGFQAATLNGGADANLTDRLTAQLLFSGQHGFKPLPAAVLGFYGGEAFGRAYDPGSLAGNDLVSAALQITQQVETGLPWLPELNVFAFADYGAVWNPNPSPYNFAWLSSAGVGISTIIGERLIATGMVAQPLTYNSALATLGVDQSTRLRFSLRLQF